MQSNSASGMDVRVSSARGRRRLAVSAWLIGGAAAISLLTFGLARIDPSIPQVSEETIWIDEVRKGTLHRRINADGVLVPTMRRVLAVDVAGRVESVFLLPGSPVTPDAVVIQLRNPDVQVDLLDARQKLVGAQSDLALLKARLDMDRLAQLARISEMETRHLESSHRDQLNRELLARHPGSISQLDSVRSREVVKDLGTRLAIEKDRLAVLTASIEEQVQAQARTIANLERVVRFHESRSAALAVTSGIEGVLIDVTAEVGEWVGAGQALGRVVNSANLKVEGRVSAEYAEDVQFGQAVEVRVGDDVVSGEVARVNPAVEDGMVAVDVSLPANLPNAAKPNLRVEVRIHVDRIEDVVHVGRPTHWHGKSSVWAYRMQGDIADRVRLELGRRSFNEVEIVSGAAAGDHLVLTDLSEYGPIDAVEVAR